MRHPKKSCPKCFKEIGNNVFDRHVFKCEGIKTCPVCSKQFNGNGKTCSYSCSNTFFRSGENNPNWKEEQYRSTCFLHHEKKCVICGENKIVTVHHMNENRNDNRPENLVPLCPTHHQYFHSRYRKEVESKILDYLNNWNKIRM